MDNKAEANIIYIVLHHKCGVARTESVMHGLNRFSHEFGDRNDFLCNRVRCVESKDQKFCKYEGEFYLIRTTGLLPFNTFATRELRGAQFEKDNAIDPSFSVQCVQGTASRTLFAVTKEYREMGNRRGERAEAMKGQLAKGYSY